MRASTFLALSTLLIAAGCQSVPYQATPIVGDTMSVGSAHFPYQGEGAWGPSLSNGQAMMGAGGYSTAEWGPVESDGLSDTSCVDGGCTMAESCTDGQFQGGPMVPPIGCAGSHCDGRCQGLCRMAHAQRMANWRAKQAHLKQFIASRPVHSHVVNCATRHCEGAVGPQFGAVTYPYYTTRGPRDFLMANPPSIGP
jgi:hypothetical protein